MARLFIDSFVCPHCNTRCSFYGEGVHDTAVLWCNGCKKGVFFQFAGCDFEEEYPQIVPIETERINDYYPHRTMTIAQSIPNEVAIDFLEANKCYDVIAPKATVAMCRRALQNTCLTVGATPKADLINQIDELEAKRIINKGLKDIAHTIRVMGNWGAHPQQDLLKDVTLDDALEIMNFTHEFLEEVFVRPARLATIKKRKGIK